MRPAQKEAGHSHVQMKVLRIGAKWCEGCEIIGPRWKEIKLENPCLETEFYDFELLRLSGKVGKEKLVEIINQYRDK